MSSSLAIGVVLVLLGLTVVLMVPRLSFPTEISIVNPHAVKVSTSPSDESVEVLHALDTCTDTAPPSTWAYHTCEGQRLHTNKCRLRRERVLTDGYCHRTCGACQLHLPAMYGGGIDPLVAGTDTCAQFRDVGGGGELVLGPAGLFNTGTNLLQLLLTRNCRQAVVGAANSSWVFNESSRAKKAHIWQVPWGKHNPVTWRGSFFAPGFKNLNITRVLPVMMIKDPLTWIKSMCRKPYAASFKTPRPACAKVDPRLKNAPTLEDTQTTVHFQRNRSVQYKSLVHMWSEWNRAYLDMPTPRLIVRYEDLLFNPEPSIKKICDCAGGVMSNGPFNHFEKPAKWGKGHGDNGTDRAKALERYGNPVQRLAGYSAADLKFIRESWDQELAKLFHYHHGIDTTV